MVRDRSGMACYDASHRTGAHVTGRAPRATGTEGVTMQNGALPKPVSENKRKLGLISPVALENVRRIVGDHDHPDNYRASVWAVEMNLGRPKQRVESDSADGLVALLQAFAGLPLAARFNVIDAASRELPEPETPAVSEADATDAVLPAGGDL